MPGSCAAAAKGALSGAIEPAGLRWSTSSHTSSVLARKLNMMVVMTTWLPRQACSQPGTAAHAMPNSAPPMAISGSSSQAGNSCPPHSATSAVPSPPSMAWPSPPMLNRPAWKATATASAVKMKVVA
jgi:hypothetical protein